MKRLKRNLKPPVSTLMAVDDNDIELSRPKGSQTSRLLSDDEVEELELDGLVSQRAREYLVDNPYKTTSVMALTFARIGWLSILVVGLASCTGIMETFHTIIKRDVELAYFMPLVMGHGSNSGGQTVSTVIQALGAKSIRQSDWRNVVYTEVGAGVCSGFFVGLLIIPLSLVLGTPNLVTVTCLIVMPLIGGFSNMLGAGLPFLAVHLGYDPAVVAAPVTSTLIDSLGLFLYFLCAQFLAMVW